MSEQAYTLEKWSRAYINDLPDSAFAYIELGGKKDSEGKTSPRRLRHLPYKDKNGKVDASHVRNALSRLKQTHISEHAKAKALRRLKKAAKSIGIDSKTELTDIITYDDTSLHLGLSEASTSVNLIDDITDTFEIEHGVVLMKRYSGDEVLITKQGNSVQFYDGYGNSYNYSELGDIIEDLKDKEDFILQGYITPYNSDGTPANIDGQYDYIQCHITDVLKHGSDLTINMNLYDRTRIVRDMKLDGRVKQVRSFHITDKEELLKASLVLSKLGDSDGVTIQSARDRYFEGDKLVFKPIALKGTIISKDDKTYKLMTFPQLDWKYYSTATIHTLSNLDIDDEVEVLCATGTNDEVRYAVFNGAKVKEQGTK